MSRPSKTEGISILSGVCRFGKSNRTQLQSIAYAELGNGDIVFVRHRHDLGLMKYLAVGNGGICLNGNAVLIAVFRQLRRSVADMEQYLICHRLYFAGFIKAFDIADQEV